MNQKDLIFQEFSAHSLIKDLPRKDQEEIFAIGKEEVIEPNTFLLREGDKAAHFLVGFWGVWMIQF